MPNLQGSIRRLYSLEPPKGFEKFFPNASKKAQPKQAGGIASQDI